MSGRSHHHQQRSHGSQEEKGCWLWKKPPPLSKKPMNVVDPFDATKIKVVKPKAKKVSFKIKDRLLKEFGCNICRKKNIMKCPSCSTDIADYLHNPQVNREMMGVIESLQRQAKEMGESSEELSTKSEETLKPEEESDVSKPSDSGEEVLEEVKENDEEEPPQKKRKGAGGKVVANVEESIDVAEVASNAVV